MNEIITNGTEIKQRIISEVNNARQYIYLAMAWFTDRDIANSIIEAKHRNVIVDIILSSNIQNETVKQMFRNSNINVHAFDTGDERGMMHHKFCLIDNTISINGSYNYSYNASNNNVENVHVSNDHKTYKQLLSEFERLKYNIENNLDVNATMLTTNNNPQIRQINLVDSFSQQLSNLIYSSIQIDSNNYKRQGYERSKESIGNIDVFKTEYKNIKVQIGMFATDDSLNSKKNILLSNINTAFASVKSDLETDSLNETNILKSKNEIERRQLSEKNAEIKEEKFILESGNQSTNERGLLQINKEIEKNKLEKRMLEQSFIVKPFWRIGTIFALLGLCVFVYYLSMFFASAMYKVFFEGNRIRASLEAGMNPDLPQLVDANAILKIFEQQGSLFGIMAISFFLIPVLLSNLKLLGSTKRLVNIFCFWLGLLIFDILVSTMVTINTDEIKRLLLGKESQLQIWEVIKHGEFWLIFVFGMLPLIITHYIINYVVTSYKSSQRELVDAEKDRKIKLLDEEMLELNTLKDSISNKIRGKDDAIKNNNDNILSLEKDLNHEQIQVENKYADLSKYTKSVFDDFNSRITSGKIFTDEILNSVVSAYKSGFIEYLPNYYSENEITKRVIEIENVIANN